MHRPLIFLDIDGVLIAYPEGEHTPPKFTLRCVEAFKSILQAVPRARIVLSSTWRWPQHVNRLHEQWVVNGFPESLVFDATPDLRSDPEVSPLYRRGLEIKAWLDTHSEIGNWVVIDDAHESIEPILGSDRCVFTKPDRGLTTGDAERAVGILQT
jgi:hypothetical protein